MWLCCCSRTDEIIWSAILYGVLCNSSHLNNGGCCQVNTFPAGICAAGATGLRLRSLPFFSGSLDLSLTHTLALTSLPQTLLHSSTLALPHISSIYPRDPEFNYWARAAVGGRLSCTGTAERNSDTQHVVLMHHGNDFTAG